VYALFYMKFRLTFSYQRKVKKRHYLLIFYISLTIEKKNKKKEGSENKKLRI